MDKYTILVIDDYIPLLEEITGFLNFEGYTCISASDGLEGIQKALKYKPDLILCDIEMPKMNGYEVLKCLEIMPSTLTIPFIFLTAKVQKDDLRLGLHLGANEYLTKPLNFKKLTDSISKQKELNNKNAKSWNKKAF